LACDDKALNERPVAKEQQVTPISGLVQNRFIAGSATVMGLESGYRRLNMVKRFSTAYRAAP
jgi:hypothetical protein